MEPIYSLRIDGTDWLVCKYGVEIERYATMPQAKARYRELVIEQLAAQRKGPAVKWKNR